MTDNHCSRPTFPYLVELSLVPLAVLLGGMQVVATLDEEHMAARPLIYGMVILLGLALLGWSTYRVWASVGTTEWEKVGESFALAFWLPTALLPAIYIAALSMQYGKTISMMKTAQLPSLGARLDLYLHHKLNLRRLSAFSLSPGRARQYARAGSRAERLAILQSTSD